MVMDAHWMEAHRVCFGMGFDIRGREGKKQIWKQNQEEQQCVNNHFKRILHSVMAQADEEAQFLILWAVWETTMKCHPPCLDGRRFDLLHEDSCDSGLTYFQTLKSPLLACRQRYVMS